MSNIEEREGYSREAYDKTTEDETSLKAQIAGAKTADEVMAIAMKLKEAERNKKELDNEAYREAMTEEQDRAKKEKKEAENKVWDEALAENAEFDQNKALDKAAENLKEQLGQAKSADEMIELANQMKEIESRKAKLAENSKTELADAIQEDETASAKKAKKILNSLNPHLKYSYSNPEEYRQSLKRLQKDEQEKIMGFIGKINDDSISSKELFDLQELMFRSQGSMDKETQDKIWEDIELVKKRKKEKYKNDTKDEPALEKDGTDEDENPFEGASAAKIPLLEKWKKAAVDIITGKETLASSEANRRLKNLFDARDLDPFWNRVSKEQEESANKLRELFKELDQSALAQKFFDDTIGRRIDNNRQAYMVYGLLKGTEFADKFKELESARLRKAGFGEFTL